MEKRKRWQKLLILGVLALTLYNIFPTIFFYTKPLDQPIEQKQAEKISMEILHRINHLEKDTEKWLGSFCKLLKIKPQSMVKDGAHIALSFKSLEDANRFRTHLPRAGSLIPFVPCQLSVFNAEDTLSKTVVIQRKIPLRFQESDKEQYFQFAKKFDDNQQPTPLYKALVFDRALQLAMAIAGPSENAKLAQSLIATQSIAEKQDLAVKISQSLLSFVKVFGENDQTAKRYFSSFSQIETDNKDTFIKHFLESLEGAKDQVKLERISLQSEAQTLQAKGDFLDTDKQQRLQQLASIEKTLESGEALVKKHKSIFVLGKTPLTLETLNQKLNESFATAQKHNSSLQTLFFEGSNPFIQKMAIDWGAETIELSLFSDLIALKERLQEQGKSRAKEQLEQCVFNEIAYESRQSGEQIRPFGSHFLITLNHLEGSQSFLALRLSVIAQAKAQELRQALLTYWHPKHPDLVRENFPIWDYETYKNLPKHEQKLGLVIYAPAGFSELPQNGMRNSSIYVMAKGIDKILQKLQANPHAEGAKQFKQDFNALKHLLQQSGLFGYAGSMITTNAAFANDFIFEGEDFYLPVLKSSREDFAVHGTKRFALLEFTNSGQRILAQNKIANQIHEDLLKWRDDYHAAQLSLGGSSPLDVPKPTRNVLFDNIALSCKKYFAGDDRKILRWGLDLSGGKTVQIELRDQNQQLVTADEDINQGINELFQRVNKMGVSEVSIRKEGHRITLDFPGTQNLSAQELIKSSTMYFHIVNEKFNERNPSLAQASQQFLQDIWNEAVVTGKKSAEEINQIAWRHLHGDSMDAEVLQPRSDAARLLYENGLRLANPYDQASSSLFNDALSKIAVFRGEDFTQWQGRTHPLIITFHNFAVEGSNLKNVQSSYDPNKGNFLNFEIKGKESLKSGEKIHPREDLYAWTSQFSKDKIAGTPNAVVSSNDGWRMAVLLNGTIITAPTLNAPIRDGASIEGSFTQREVSQLEADLKAGSLSYTPHILSEKNVSPELGTKERHLGILATCIALVLVVACMIAYYRFGGLVASVAVILNLLIMWATLQNLGATLTLATIAGAILTLGMAVDANVLVFERIREEFALSGRLASALFQGYQKAFSAILDSNVTTIIAALILLQFDSGPIKGFALTLIIGIASSMFTALFMTRTFFTTWVQNPKRTRLSMANWIKATKFPFLKYAKLAFFLSGLVILAGGYLFVQQKHTIMGMDFTGGYCLNLELEQSPNTQYREAIEKALTAQGISAQDVQVRQLTPAHHVRLFLSKNLQQPGKPFFGMATHGDPLDNTQITNPRILWVLNALKQGQVSVSNESLPSLEHNWTEISGQLSDSMRTNALIGLGIAILSILVYITFRFEFKYAISATLCLAHDLAISLAAIAIMQYFGLALQIDLHTLAALMTIIGYSLNDTIIVFDRIREDMRLMKKAPFTDIIHHALNVTLSRTVMTSLTTFLVLLPLVFLGGSTIFAFSLVMIVGVVFGTLSSLFIAAPLLTFFHKRQEEKAKATPADTKLLG